MYYENGKAKDLVIAYIGGGSRGWAWGFMKDLALNEKMEGTVRLYDIDQAAAENNRIIGERISEHPDCISKWNYLVADTLEEALTEADFVIISILPGTFDEMESDVHEPEKYGIYQAVGDTVGPGGFMRALRTIPVYVTFARAIHDYCPEAWVINYTNPMSLCVRTLYEVFPKIKAFGCCHEVFGTQKLLATMLKEEGIEHVAREEIRINVSGINHFTWLNKVSWGGMDLMPLYGQFVEKYFESGFEKEQDTNWMNNSFACAHRVKFDLYRKYGMIAAAGDRHLAEFVPGEYLQSPDKVRKWKFGLTTVKWRKEDLKQRLERSRKLVCKEEKIELEPSGEEGCLLMRALLGFGDMISNVNIPNYGQIPNLPLKVVVETNALFCRDAVYSVHAGKLDGNVHALVMRHVCNQENTLKAAINCDRELAFTTFMNDPQMKLTDRKGKELFEAMLNNTMKYLPGQWKNS